MSATLIIPEKLTRNAIHPFPAAAALDAADGAVIKWDGPDERMFILIENAGASEAAVAVAKGNSPAGAPADLTETIPAGESRLITIESARYLMTKGALRGHVQLTGSADLKAAAVILG